MPDFLGDPYSLYEERTLNKKVSNSDLVLACLNPLVEAVSSTVPQMSCSKPFYHTVYDPKKKVDPIKSAQFTQMFDNANAIENAMICQSDAFNLGIGLDEFLILKNPDTGWLEIGAMERRPPDTFIRPKDANTVSTSQRWKGIFVEKGVKQFEQTIYSRGKANSGQIVRLNPNQVFSITPANAKFPDGPGILEYLIPYLDGAQFAFNMTYVVMADQLNPKDIKIGNPQPGDEEVAQKYLENQNSIERVPLKDNFEVDIPSYPARTDVLDFFNHFEKAMYRVVFPVAAISGEGGGILDNSSNLAKEDIFFSFIDFWRQKICRSFNKVGNYILDINGYKKQGYTYALVPAPIVPRNIEIEQKIMSVAVNLGKISTEEYRYWLNSTVLGLRLEDDFQEELQLGDAAKKPESLTNNGTLAKVIDQVLNGKKEPKAVYEEKARKVS